MVDVVGGGDTPVVLSADPVAALAALEARYEADRVRWQLAISAGGVGSWD